MDDAGPRSLFAVVYRFGTDPPHYSILQLDHEYTPKQIKKRQVVEKVRFNIPQEQKDPFSIKWKFPPWLISPLKSCTDDLCMLPNWNIKAGRPVIPLHGFKFNFRTASFLPINLPDDYKSHGHVVNLSGHIYFTSHDWSSDRRSLKCYDPDKKSWKALAPFPHLPSFKDRFKGRFEGRIVASAVWGDTILLNVEFCGIWAYDVSTNKWYPVDFDDHECSKIVGESVVVGDTIYALTDFSVLALSMKKEGTDDHLVFKCSLLTNEMMKKILPGEDVYLRSRDLVHLGEDKFCVVQSCELLRTDCQPILLTYIKIKRDNSVIVMDEYFLQVKIQPNEYFLVTQCFSLPKGATTGLLEGKSSQEGKSFNVDPYPEDYEKEEVYKHPLQQESDSNIAKIIAEKLAEGSSIYVRNLPPNATVRQLKKGLTKFGPIKSDGIRVVKDEEGKLFASVEFENHCSKRCAIAASTITIEGCLAKITEMGWADLILADCNRTRAVGSSSFGKNKVKNHGKVSPSNKKKVKNHGMVSPSNKNKVKNHGKVS